MLTELRRNLVERGIPAERVDRRLAHMTGSFPDALVTGYESLIDGMTNHPKDRHVLVSRVVDRNRADDGECRTSRAKFVNPRPYRH